jgi:hypothetical protein
MRERTRMNDEQTEPNANERGGDTKAPDEQAMLYCPVCSERLKQSRCKLVCEKCGYFMSCADYY